MDLETSTQIPEIHKAIVLLRELNADEKLQQQVHYREKRLHDEATALGNAQRKGEAIGLKKGLEKGKAIGIEEGFLSALAQLVKEGILTVENAAERANISVSEFKNKTHLT